jgi:hypothetical protein
MFHVCSCGAIDVDWDFVDTDNGWTCLDCLSRYPECCVCGRHRAECSRIEDEWFCPECLRGNASEGGAAKAA